MQAHPFQLQPIGLVMRVSHTGIHFTGSDIPHSQVHALSSIISEWTYPYYPHDDWRRGQHLVRPPRTQHRVPSFHSTNSQVTSLMWQGLSGPHHGNTSLVNSYGSTIPVCRLQQPENEFAEPVGMMVDSVFAWRQPQRAESRSSKSLSMFPADTVHNTNGVNQSQCDDARDCEEACSARPCGRADEPGWAEPDSCTDPEWTQNMTIKMDKKVSCHKEVESTCFTSRYVPSAVSYSPITSKPHEFVDNINEFGYEQIYEADDGQISSSTNMLDNFKSFTPSHSKVKLGKIITEADSSVADPIDDVFFPRHNRDARLARRYFDDRIDSPDMPRSWVQLPDPITEPLDGTFYNEQALPWEGGQPEVTLLDEEQWEEFYRLGTEMIVTRNGRRMFPFLRYSVKNLDPDAMYTLAISIQLVNTCHYKFVNGLWTKGEPCDTDLDANRGRIHIHSQSPSPGKHWMGSDVTFEKVKISNCLEKFLEEDFSTQGQILLSSMHKYNPCLFVIRVRNGSTPGHTPLFKFESPITSFIAVTSYQSSEITQLKIDRNPFAKGFRDDQRRSMIWRSNHAQESLRKTIHSNSNTKSCGMNTVPTTFSLVSEPSVLLKIKSGESITATSSHTVEIPRNPVICSPPKIQRLPLTMDWNFRPEISHLEAKNLSFVDLQRLDPRNCTSVLNEGVDTAQVNIHKRDWQTCTGNKKTFAPLKDVPTDRLFPNVDKTSEIAWKSSNFNYVFTKSKDFVECPPWLTAEAQSEESTLECEPKVEMSEDSSPTNDKLTEEPSKHIVCHWYARDDSADGKGTIQTGGDLPPPSRNEVADFKGYSDYEMKMSLEGFEGLSIKREKEEPSGCHKRCNDLSLSNCAKRLCLSKRNSAEELSPEEDILGQNCLFASTTSKESVVKTSYTERELAHSSPNIKCSEDLCQHWHGLELSPIAPSAYPI